MNTPLSYIGYLLHGYCGGEFGNKSCTRRIEAMGVDWIVAREVESGEPCFAHFGSTMGSTILSDRLLGQWGNEFNE